MSATPARRPRGQAECERLRERGVAFTKEPTPAGPVVIARFADGCGNLIQLHQPV